AAGQGRAVCRTRPRRSGPGRRRADRRDAGAPGPDQPADRGHPARRAPVPAGGQRARPVAREGLTRAMCLIVLAWRVHPRFPLALIANRDEAHARPTAAAGFDPEAPDVYGGRDLVQGGSWLQVSTRGRLAAVTNVRAGIAREDAPRSRGALVRDFVRGESPAGASLLSLGPLAGEFGRFNLLAWDGDDLVFASNHPGFASFAVEPGLHAMSNGAFDAPWPKSAHATQALEAWLHSPSAASTGMPGIDAL